VIGLRASVSVLSSRRVISASVAAGSGSCCRVPINGFLVGRLIFVKYASIDQGWAKSTRESHQDDATCHMSLLPAS